MSETTLRFGGQAYKLALRKSGWTLVKTSKKASPGQMSLFGDGPKDGDTKPGADGKILTFRGGRWHDESAKRADSQSAPKQVLASITDNPAAKLPQAMRNSAAQQLKTVDPKHLSEATQKAFQLLESLNIKEALADRTMEDWSDRLETPEETDNPAPYVPTEDAKKILAALKQSPHPDITYEQMLSGNGWPMSALRKEIKDANLYLKALDLCGVDDLNELLDLTASDISEGKGAHWPLAKALYDQAQKYANPDLAIEVVAEETSISDLKYFADNARAEGEEEVAAMYEAIAADNDFRKIGRQFANFEPSSIGGNGEYYHRQEAIDTLNQIAIAIHPVMKKFGASDQDGVERVFDWMFEKVKDPSKVLKFYG